MVEESRPDTGSGRAGMRTAGALVILLATTGFVTASYVTVVTFGWMRPDAPWVPRVCRMDPDTCSSVVFSSQARLFGVPNSVLGQLGYLALVTAAASGRLFTAPIYWVAVAMSLGTVALGLYLAYVLLFVIRAPCVACFAAHAINLALACVLLLAGPG